MPSLSSVQAQQRVDDIQAYRREAAQLAAAGVYQPEPEQRVRIEAYHNEVLRDYSDR